MSEISNTKEKRLEKLLEASTMIINTGNARSFIIANQDFIKTVVPSDFITLFDKLISEGYPIDELKTCSNKILNIFYQTIQQASRIEPEKDSFLWVLEQNNMEMDRILNSIRPVFKAFVNDEQNKNAIEELASLFEKLEPFASHYVIKENVLFPIIEKTWPDYRCIQIMWSFHDDIRGKLKQILNGLRNGIENMDSFKRWVGDIFFNMKAIRFREEKILFPAILASISDETLIMMNKEAFDIGYPYFQPVMKTFLKKGSLAGHMVDLGTGKLSIDQLILIFNHLPVDITFVDEEDKVRFFSTPKKRIFPRSNAIIGREVKNCHPPESVHVVEKIVSSFRRGEKSTASFWIKMKGEYILIQYFAVRDEKNTYKGVIEVTQEVSDIKALEGEKRLLDW